MMKNALACVLSLMFCANFSWGQLSGTVTVGTTGMYPTISSAINEINAYGLSGHVVISIEPGVYDESIYLTNISDLTADSTLTFRAMSGLGTVTVQTLSNNPAAALISMTDCPYVTFDNLRFNIGSQNIWFIEAEGCHHFKLNNCTFTEPQISAQFAGNSGKLSVIESNHVYIDSTEIPRRLFITNDTMVVVTNSEIRCGYYSSSALTNTVFAGYCDSLYFTNTIVQEYGIGGHTRVAEIINCEVAGIGFSGTAPQTILIKDNLIDGFVRINTGEIINNVVTNPHNSSACIWMNSCDSCLIDRNIVHAKMEKGIYAPTGNGRITNNMVLDTWDNQYTFDRHAIDVAGNFYIAHNSVYMKDATVDTEAAGIRILGDSEEVVNNIVLIEHPIAPVLTVTGTNGTFNSENNIFMNTLGPLAISNGTTYYTLSQWNTATNLDNSSSSMVPQFEGSDDLHLTDATGILLAAQSDSVTYDIDSEIRQSMTHVGADQIFNLGLSSYDVPSVEIGGFPNPFHDAFRIAGFTEGTKNLSIAIYGIDGREVLRINNYMNNDLIRLPHSGVYQVAVFEDDVQVSKFRMIKM